MTAGTAAPEARAFRANIPRYYGFQVLFNTWLWMPVWVVFFQDRGLTMTHIGLADAWGLALMALAEVPTGIVADLYGRRVSLALGALLTAIASAILVFTTNLPMVLTAYVPWMIGGTLVYGADEAFLYDSMRAAGQSDEDFTRANARAMTLIKGAQAVSSVAGSALAAVLALHVVYVAYALLTLLAAAAALSLREPPRTGRSGGPTPFWSVLGNARRLLGSRPALRYILLYRAVLNTVPGVLVLLLFQPYAVAVGVPVAWLGAAMLGARLLSMLGTYLGGFARQQAGHALLAVTLGVTLAALLLMASSGTWVGLLFLGAASLSVALQAPLLSTLLNREVTDDVRATVLSIQNLLLSLVMLLVEPAAGAAVDIVGFPWTFAGLGLFVAVAAVPVLFAWWRRTTAAGKSEPAAP
ncbi:MAG TPA: MFS transporter [Bacillota bacterium]